MTPSRSTFTVGVASACSDAIAFSARYSWRNPIQAFSTTTTKMNDRFGDVAERGRQEPRRREQQHHGRGHLAEQDPPRPQLLPGLQLVRAVPSQTFRRLFSRQPARRLGAELGGDLLGVSGVDEHVCVVSDPTPLPRGLAEDDDVAKL